MNPYYLKTTVASMAAMVTTAAVWKLNGKKESVALLPAAAGTAATRTSTIRSERLPSCVHAVHTSNGGFSTFAENGLTDGLCCVGDGVKTGLGGVGNSIQQGLSDHGKGVAAAGKHTANGMVAAGGFLACALVVSAVINKKL